MKHVSASTIPAHDLIKTHVYGSNYRDKLSDGEIADSAEAIKANGLPEPPWAMLLDGKFYHIAGDSRLAGMERLAMTEYPYRVVDVAAAGIEPRALALMIRTISDQVRQLSFAERVRQIRQHSGIGMQAGDIAVRIKVQKSYVSGLMKLDRCLPPGWEERLNGMQAQKVYGSRTPREDYDAFLSTGKLPKRDDAGNGSGNGSGSDAGGNGSGSGSGSDAGGNGSGRGGRAVGKEKAVKAFQDALSAEHGDWVRKLPWTFITLPKGDDDVALFKKWLDELFDAVDEFIVRSAQDSGDSGPIARTE